MHRLGLPEVKRGLGRGVAAEQMRQTYGLWVQRTTNGFPAPCPTKPQIFVYQYLQKDVRCAEMLSGQNGTVLCLPAGGGGVWGSLL